MRRATWIGIGALAAFLASAEAATACKFLKRSASRHCARHYRVVCCPVLALDCRGVPAPCETTVPAKPAPPPAAPAPAPPPLPAPPSPSPSDVRAQPAPAPAPIPKAPEPPPVRKALPAPRVEPAPAPRAPKMPAGKPPAAPAAGVPAAPKAEAPKPPAPQIVAPRPAAAEAPKVPATAPAAPKPPSPAKAKPVAPAGKPAAKQSQADFFSVQPNPVRTWTDNTGQYRCRGTLVGRLPEGTVRILREDGRYVRVAFARLSLADQQVVLRTTAGLAMH